MDSDVVQLKPDAFHFDLWGHCGGRTGHLRGRQDRAELRHLRDRQGEREREGERKKERETDREKERERGRERGRERDRERVRGKERDRKGRQVEDRE